MYRDREGELNVDEFADGLMLAEVAVQLILELQAAAKPDTVHALLSAQPAYWAQMHQAAGMLSVQLDVALDDALVRLRAASFSQNRELGEVAGDVVARRLHLEMP